ncbi:alpha/beta fold hydrolase [[Haemophilus] felis]|nr:alpha/beta fold hydrolase [[Haemophilus] felis]
MCTTTNLLNFQFHQLKQEINQPTLVFVHGLFGDLNNLGMIARPFAQTYSTLRIDLRNHGKSFIHSEMNYHLMAQDIAEVIKHLKLQKVVMIGHSMGGKVVMKFAALYPELVEKLVVIDMAPVVYAQRRHDNVFAALAAVTQSEAQSRAEAEPILAQHIQEEGVKQFVLKSFDKDRPYKFRFNWPALEQNYNQISDWQPCFVEKPTLFIRGGNSDYVKAEDREEILAQFPQAKSFTINGTGHWVHAEKSDFVIRAIERFLHSN